MLQENFLNKGTELWGEQGLKCCSEREVNVRLFTMEVLGKNFPSSAGVIGMVVSYKSCVTKEREKIQADKQEKEFGKQWRAFCMELGRGGDVQPLFSLISADFCFQNPITVPYVTPWIRSHCVCWTGGAESTAHMMSHTAAWLCTKATTQKCILTSEVTILFSSSPPLPAVPFLLNFRSSKPDECWSAVLFLLTVQRLTFICNNRKCSMLSVRCSACCRAFEGFFNGKNWSFISWATSEKAQVAVCSQPASCLLLSRSCFSRKRAGCCWQTNWCCVNILFLLKATHRGRVGASSLGAKMTTWPLPPSAGRGGGEAPCLPSNWFPLPFSNKLSDLNVCLSFLCHVSGWWAGCSELAGSSRHPARMENVEMVHVVGKGWDSCRGLQEGCHHWRSRTLRTWVFSQMELSTTLFFIIFEALVL